VGERVAPPRWWAGEPWVGERTKVPNAVAGEHGVDEGDPLARAFHAFYAASGPGEGWGAPICTAAARVPVANALGRALDKPFFPEAEFAGRAIPRVDGTRCSRGRGPTRCVCGSTADGGRTEAREGPRAQENTTGCAAPRRTPTTRSNGDRSPNTDPRTPGAAPSRALVGRNVEERADEVGPMVKGPDHGHRHDSWLAREGMGPWGDYTACGLSGSAIRESGKADSRAYSMRDQQETCPCDASAFTGESGIEFARRYGHPTTFGLTAGACANGLIHLLHGLDGGERRPGWGKRLDCG